MTETARSTRGHKFSLTFKDTSESSFKNISFFPTLSKREGLKGNNGLFLDASRLSECCHQFLVLAFSQGWFGDCNFSGPHPHDLMKMTFSPVSSDWARFAEGSKINDYFPVVYIPSLRKCLRQEGLPNAHIRSLHPKGKAEDLPTVAKANNWPGEFCCFYSVCSPTCLQLCLKHSINYNCTSVTKLMSNTNLALDLGLRLHSDSLNSLIACAKNKAPREEVRQKAHLGSLERFFVFKSP